MPPTPKGGSGATLEQVASDPPVDPAPQPTTPAAATPSLPDLPDKPTDSGKTLQEKVVTIFGPAGVGKSTLASQWGDRPFFFNCSGELAGLNVLQLPIGDWTEFLQLGAAVKAAPGKYTSFVIDTTDTLERFCSVKIRRKLGIAHESDAEWGKGWGELRDEFALAIAKLASIPNTGLVLITHAQEIEMKNRSGVWQKMVPSLSKSVRATCVNTADLVLYVDFKEGDDTVRVIRTKPSQYWEAKERGTSPRLPDAIDWPFGTNGYEIIKKLWEKGDK